MGALFDALPHGGSASSDAAREQMILDYAGQGFLTWQPEQVAWTENGHTIIFSALRDGIKLEGIRLTGSATLTQRLCDLYEGVLPTAKMCDIIWQKAAVKLSPLTRQITSKTAAMADQSNRIDQAIGEQTGLVGNLGKYWVLTNKLLVDSPGCAVGTPTPIHVPNVCANYGWYVHSGSSPAVTPGLRVIQPVSRCHDRLHVDYSQEIQFVFQQIVLDGQPGNLQDVLMDPALAPLLSSEGALQTVRQPGADLGWSSYAVASGNGGIGAPKPVVTTTASVDNSSSGSGGSGVGKAIGYAFATGLATAVAYKLVTGAAG